MIDEKEFIEQLEDIRDHLRIMIEQCEPGTPEYFGFSGEYSGLGTAIAVCVESQVEDGNDR